ncbi:MAG TPA: hypothetical protein ENK55_07285 [Actinobacteria bacterium]|nr:hypothetical protein [Actinomycetota bacterium]
MAEHQVMKGRRLSGSARAPKTYATNRRCAHPGCETTLSRYNRREYCYTHAPTKYPRLRGRVVSDD